MPHIELDALYWEPNWVPRAPAAFRSLVEEAVVWQVLVWTLGCTLRRKEMFGGGRESLGSAFLSRDSILLWAVTTFHRGPATQRSASAPVRAVRAVGLAGAGRVRGGLVGARAVLQGGYSGPASNSLKHRHSRWFQYPPSDLA